MPEREEMLSPKEVAKLSSITLDLIYRELWAGRIPGARKIGKRWMIPVGTAMARLRGRKNADRPAPIETV